MKKLIEICENNNLKELKIILANHRLNDKYSILKYDDYCIMKCIKLAYIKKYPNIMLELLNYTYMEYDLEYLFNDSCRKGYKNFSKIIFNYYKNQKREILLLKLMKKNSINWKKFF